MKTIFKPTRLVSRLWVFSCLLGLSLASCQTSQTSQTSQTNQISQPAPPTRPALTKAPPSSGYLGLTLPAATTKAAQEGRRSRVIMVDGQRRPVTKDLRPRRLNFSLNQGKVIAVTKG